MQTFFTFTIHILCFTEHWLKFHDTFKLENYNLATSYTRSDYKNGGACIFVHNSLKYSVIEVEKLYKNLCEDKVFECCGIRCFLENIGNVKIFCIYRNPSSNVQVFLDKLSTLLEATVRSQSKIIICGDINVNVLQTLASDTVALKDILKIYNLKITINEATRVTQTSATCIDNIFCNLSQYNASVYDAAISDHKGQLLRVKHFTPKPENKTQFVYKRSHNTKNLEKLLGFLQNESWHCVNTAPSVNKGCNAFCETFLRYYNLACPVNKIRIGKITPWITQGIRKSSKTKRDLLLKIRSGRTDLKPYYSKYQSILKAVICEAKKRYNTCEISRLASNNNISKAVWNIVKKETGRDVSNNTDTIFELRDQVNGTVTDPKLMAQILNSNFVGTSSHNTHMTKSKQYPQISSSSISKVSESIFLRPADEAEVFDCINNLKNKKSSGADGISNFIIKCCAIHLTKPLCRLINLAIEQSSFPDILKLAKINPIFKKGDITDWNNYRPIALLPSLSKVFEIIINNRLICFLENKNILVPNQYGFRSNKSTSSAVLNLVQSISDGCDNNQFVLAIFCDLTKAFDSINHQILLEKLENYGIRGSVLKLIESYLSDRLQFVELKNYINNIEQIHQSDTLPIQKGVPQGSVLGPLLFLAYINDLPSYLPFAETILYADDTTILIKHSNLEKLFELANNCLRSLHEWMETNNLSLNSTKTKYMLFSKKNMVASSSKELLYNDQKLEFVHSFNFLGITIDSKLIWVQHIDLLCNKLASACYALKVIKPVVSVNALKMAYHGYFISHASYGIISWGSTNYLDRVFKLQKKALRILFNLDPKESCRPYFITHRLMTMSCIYMFNLLIYVRSNMQQFTLSNRNPRSFQIFYHRHTSKKFEKSPEYVAVKLFNNMPLSIRKIEDIRKFKKELKKFFLQKAFYTVNEYLLGKF